MSLADRLRPQSAAPEQHEERALLALAQMRGRGQRRPPPKAAASAMSIIKPLLKDGGMGLSELKRRWPEIVGESLAKATAPDKLRAGALTIRTPGAMAPFVQHQIPLIIERCALAGAAVKKVTLTQAAPPPPAQPNVGKPRALTLDEEEALARGVDRIEYAGLRRALLRLGRAVQRG
ncbi:MAG: DUF721 domain-containing protein [Alphaproteobacteria bacterium]|nr:DUF721 domain-containing protein [Alphaproteobacteria bacterium]